MLDLGWRGLSVWHQKEHGSGYKTGEGHAERSEASYPQAGFVLSSLFNADVCPFAALRVTPTVYC